MKQSHEISLSGRSFGSDRQPRRKATPAAPTLSVRVPESILQRHEAITRAILEKRRDMLLRDALFVWRTSFTLQSFLRGKADVMYEEFFYKWLNTRRRKRSSIRYRRAAAHHLVTAYQRVISALRSQRAISHWGRVNQRRKSRLSSYYMHALKKKVFRSWKACTLRNRASHTLQAEHQERRSKIQSFVKNLQKTATATSAPPVSQRTYRREQDRLHLSGARRSGPRTHSPNDWTSTKQKHEQDLEHCPRSSPPPVPMGSPPLQQFSMTGQRGRREEVDDRAEQFEVDEEWLGGVDCANSSSDAPPSFSSLPASPSPSATRQRGRVPSSPGASSPRSSIATSPLRSPGRSSQATRPGRRTNSATTINSTNARAYGTRQFQSTMAGRSRAQTTADEESAKERRERLRSLQRETAERVAKNKANEEAMKRRKELEEEQELAQQRKEYRSKLSHKSRGGQRSARGETDKKAADATSGSPKLSIAAAFRKRQLLIRRGLAPWLLLVKERRLDWLKACTFYDDGLVQSAWEAWVGLARARKRAFYIHERKLTRLADSHFRQVLLRYTWRCFVQYRLALRARAKAVHSHCVKHGGRRAAFAAWRVSLEKRRRAVTHALTKHSRQSRASILASCWRQWKQYLQDAEIEKEIDSRVDMTWVRVQEWLT
mmetsp:Transcript_925/g.1604  ORF Transcript_925/g.1604 Transcript_925/m.1604 type:complete len:659 (+) Transcript_925:73-2049(+)